MSSTPACANVDLIFALVRASIKTMASSRTAPSAAQWDRQRSQSLPSSLALEELLDMTWAEIVDQCGLISDEALHG